MNKSVILVPVFILALSLLFPCLSNLVITQVENDAITYGCFEPILGEDLNPPTPTETKVYDNFSQEYFRNLYDYGKNYQDSCGYVAIGMWLTYFDAYWNDSIVGSNYESTGYYAYYSNKNVTFTSPGLNDPILSDDNPLRDKNNRSRYIEYMINEQSTTNLHAYLIKIGNDLGYVDDSSGLGLTKNKMVDVLSTYLSLKSLDESFVFNSYMPSVDVDTTYPGADYTYSEYIRREIITYVKLGIPVFTFLKGQRNGGFVGHVVLAYDYDESTDDLYAHFGLGYTKNYISIPTTHYTQIAGYFVGTPSNLEHVHAYKYRNKDDSQQYICSCQLSSHEHRYHYDSATSTSHRRYCFCGYSSYESHAYSGIVGKFLVCEKCNYMKRNDGGIIDIPNPYSTPEILEDMERINDEIGKNQYLMSA